jgi:hypothetical protein
MEAMFEDVNWIQETRDEVLWRTLINNVVIFQVP